MDETGQHRRIMIVGAGFSGIGMAIRLKQSGIEDFIVLERAPTSAARGTSTPTRAAAATCRRICTHSPSRPTRTGRTPTRRSPRSATTCAAAPTTSTSGGTSSPASRSKRRPGTRTSSAGRSRPAPATLTAGVLVSGMGPLTEPKLPDVPGHRELRGQDDALRAVGSRLRAGGQARRLDRHRRIGDPVRAGDPASRSRSCTCSSARRRGSCRTAAARSATASAPCFAASRPCSG